jgi:hypothetical protein
MWHLVHIRGNGLGMAMVVATGLIAGLGSLVLKLSDALVMLAVGVALIAMDLIVRLFYRQVPGWLMKREYGGYFFFVPVWILGVVVIAVNLVNVFIK